MKQSILTLMFVLGLVVSTQAQWVSIPDSNFGKWLFRNDSICMSGNSTTGWLLDTTCSRVLSTTSISFNPVFGLPNYAANRILDLTGIVYFRNLNTLYFWADSDIRTFTINCPSLRYLSLNYLPHLTSISGLPDSLVTLLVQNTVITHLPPLPATLNSLTCVNDNLDSLPPLPAGLDSLIATNSNLHRLPAIPSSVFDLNVMQNHLSTLPALPNGLKYLSCSANPLHSLPATLPDSLYSLTCWSDSLSSLPPMPLHLNSLDCNQNQISSLPSMPSQLNSLNCMYNRITTLPTLPASLLYLYISHNPLLAISVALPAGLKSLTCASDSLTALPALPSPLITLDCSYNHLSSLPELPHGITSLTCNNNTALTCIPPVYSGFLYAFYVAATNVHCIPNRFRIGFGGRYDINPNTLPLCSPSSGCEFYYNIGGSIHIDTAATCAADSLHPGPAFSEPTKVLLMKSGQVLQQFYTYGTRGGYSFKTDSLSSYTVALDTTISPFYVACPASSVRTVSLTPADSSQIEQNFGLACTGIDTFDTDYGVRKGVSFWSRFRPGRTSRVQFDVGDMARRVHHYYCSHETPTADTSGTVTVIISGPAHYTGPAFSAMAPTSVSGDTLSYRIPNLKMLPFGFVFINRGISFMLKTDTNAVIGSSVCFDVRVTPDVPDADPINDTMTRCYSVSNSWDPNEKEADPANTADTAAAWINYTVRFQNTGNDTAYDIVVRDTLSNYFDATSFQYQASSHNALIQLVGNAMTFTFPDINLVDSLHNEPLSHAWIQYKVKTKPNLPLGTQIKNTASIYFDLNPAVVTNTTLNTVQIDTTHSTVGMQDVDAAHIRIYPNPNSGNFTLETSNQQGATYIITDMLGQIIQEKTITSDKQHIDMGISASGVYTLMLKGKTGAVRIVLR